MKNYKIIASILLLFVLFGCSSSENNKTEKPVEREAKDIVITQEKRVERQEESKHKEELEGDKKGFYYSLKEKKIKTDTTEETYTRLDAQKNIRNKDSISQIQERSSKKYDSPYSYIQMDLLKSTLSKNFIVKCSSCHDNYANGIIGPSLLHKDDKFIYGTLQAYKTKEKANVLMKDLVNNMSDEELKNLSVEIAQFNKQVRQMNKDKQ